MKKIKFLMLFVALGITSSLIAQTKDYPWAVGLYGVKTEYLGDLRVYKDYNSSSNQMEHIKNTIFNFSMFYGGGAVSFDRYINRFFDAGIYASYSSIGYDNDDEGSQTFRNFKAKGLMNGNVHVRIKFLGKDDARVVPYVTIGGGILGYFDVSTNVAPDGTWNYYKDAQGNK